MLLLAPDQVTLYPASQAADGHGWALPDGTLFWTGQGSLQASPGRSDAAAGGAGGHGPYAPALVPLATLYLPPEAGPVTDGMVAQVGGKAYALSQVRWVSDPVNPDVAGLGCWVAQCEGTDQWPGP
jgi:hypothetical protein